MLILPDTCRWVWRSSFTFGGSYLSIIAPASRFESQLNHFVAVGPWASDTTSLCLSFFNCRRSTKNRTSTVVRIFRYRYIDAHNRAWHRASAVRQLLYPNGKTFLSPLQTNLWGVSCPRSFGSVLLAKLQEPNPQASPWDPQLHPGLHPTWEGSLQEFSAGPVVWALCSHCQGPGFNTCSELKCHKPCKAAKKKKQAHSHAVWSQPAHLTPAVEHQALGLSRVGLSPSSVSQLLCVFLGKWFRFSESQWSPLKTATEVTDFIEVLWKLGKVGHWGGKRTWP